MGLLELLKRKKPKEEPIETIKIEEPIKIEKAGTLDLTKRIDNSFSKLNLDKPEVLDKTVFLLDVSGSMSEIVNDKRKIEHLRSVMLKYPSARKFCFSDHVFTDNNISEPNGSTDLALAIRYLTKSKDKSKRMVLVSDGQPNDESDALKEAKILNIPIDIIFIGNKGSRGELFMENLARTTGGQHFVV